MVDYEQLERDHQRRVGKILSSNIDPRERQQIIEALVRFRDADIGAAERIASAEAKRERWGALSALFWTEQQTTLIERQREADAFLENSLLAFVGAIVAGCIVLGVIAALVP